MKSSPAKKMIRFGAVALITSCLLSSTQSLSESRPAAVGPEKGGLSIQNIMDDYIDPSADALWGSVGTIETAGKTEFRRPNSQAEWDGLRARALKLIAGTKYLAAAKAVGGAGHGALADISTPGIRTPEQILQQIKADPPQFRMAARRLQTAGQDALNAINAKDPEAFIKAGANMDAACEACHSAYWYPRTPPLPLLSPEAFGRIAQRP